MGENIDYLLEKLISESEELLESMDDIEGLVGVAICDREEEITAEMFKISLAATKESMDLKFDDYADIHCANVVPEKHSNSDHKKSSLLVNGELKTKFIENCCIEAKGTVYAETGIMNSGIHTLKRIDLGRKGAIIGGTLQAKDGVTATQIGSALGQRTEIYCGTDFSVLQKLKWNQEKKIKLDLKLKQIDMKLNTAFAGRDKLMEVEAELKQTINKLNTATYVLIHKLDINEKAEVIVHGDIFPGTYIKICRVSYIVNRKMSKVRFKLDKVKGKIVIESL